MDFGNALLTGATVAGALKSLSVIEAFFARRNGNGKNGFAKEDHDMMVVASDRQVRFYEALQQRLTDLHDDLEDIKELLHSRDR